MSSSTLRSPTRSSHSAGRPVWLVSVLAAVAAAVAAELYGLVARGVGIPMRAGNPGGTIATPITVGMFAMAVLVAAFWGTLLGVVLAKYASRPARIYLRTAVVLTVLSLAGPLAAGHTALSTKLMLCGAHLLTAAIVIPAVTRRLQPQRGDGEMGDRADRQGVDHRPDADRAAQQPAEGQRADLDGGAHQS